MAWRKAVKHSVGEYVNGMAHTNGVESFWSVVSADGDAPDRKLLGLGGSQFTRQWLARIVFDLVVFENAISGGDLWWVNVSRPDETGPYLESSADLDDIAVSPDGMWAAYQSSETGTEEVYVRSFPVPRQPLPVSEGEGQFPRWSPDGTVIYYETGPYLESSADLDDIAVSPDGMWAAYQSSETGKRRAQSWTRSSPCGRADRPGNEFLRALATAGVGWQLPVRVLGSAPGRRPSRRRRG